MPIESLQDHKWRANRLPIPMDRLTGIHAVREALEAGRAFDRIVIAKGRQDTRIEEIVQVARRQNVSVRFEDRGQLDRLADSKDHQGIVALVAARSAGTLDEILDAANAGAGRGEKGLIVLLDGVEDPHNLGAIIRTARSRADRYRSAGFCRRIGAFAGG
jgi:23S rRNA (guanosine2251-2'-O)-methyltransferase